MYVKIHKTELSEVVCICDEDLVGKKFEDKDLQLDVTERFYKGEKKTEEEVIKILKEAGNVNIVGKESIKVAIKAGVIEKENIIKIKNIPHAQAYGAQFFKMAIYSNDQYFEGILQLRPLNKDVLDYVKKQIDKGNCLISKEVDLKYGTDLYVTSQRFAVSLGRKLKRVFKGEVKISRSIFKRSRITSKEVYRVTVLFRLE